jgi:hypothetical protein
MRLHKGVASFKRPDTIPSAADRIDRVENDLFSFFLVEDTGRGWLEGTVVNSSRSRQVLRALFRASPQQRVGASAGLKKEALPARCESIPNTVSRTRPETGDVQLPRLQCVAEVHG